LEFVRIQIPEPAWVSVPVVVPIMLLIVPPTAPPSVRPNVGPVIVPVFDSVMLPAPPTMLLAPPRVMSPAKVAPVALLLISAPPPVIPVPLSVSASVVV
jgi:hypothetical protein